MSSNCSPPSPVRRLLLLLAIGSCWIILLLVPCSYGLQNKKATNGTSIKCDNETMEENILKITGTLSDKRYPYPVTDAEFVTYCRDIKSAVHFLKDFPNKCPKLSASSKTVLSVFSYTTNQSVKKYCSRKNAKVREEIVTVAGCLNPNKRLVIKCYDRFLEKLVLAPDVQPNKDKFQYICCLTEEMKECIVERLRKTNHESCTEDTLQRFVRLFDSFSGNLFNLSCENFDDQADRCQNMIDRELKRFGHPGKSLPRNPWKTPFPIVLGIFDSAQ